LKQREKHRFVITTWQSGGRSGRRFAMPPFKSNNLSGFSIWRCHGLRARHLVSEYFLLILTKFDLTHIFKYIEYF
jgi:hypothetical protein